MVVGILSMQRVVNHGSFLQSYALKSLIEKNGHSVRFVDIKPGEKLLSTTSIRSSTPIYSHFFSKVNHILFNKVKEIRFKNKYFCSIGIDSPIQEEECDVVLIGSDEVFNFYQASPWGLSDQLLGNVNNRVFCYAGSFGNTTIEVIDKLNLKERLKEDFSHFYALSVRDNNSYECVKYLTGNEPEIHLDPVFIYDYKLEQKTITKIKYENYIAIYCYDNGINDEQSIRQIREFARKNNKKIISFGFYTRWCDYNLICSPFELLVYIKNADYVITDTFHGTVISIKQNTRFVTLVRKHNKNKLLDVLSRFELEDRIIDCFDNIENDLNREIDYRRINDVIKKEQCKAKKYLSENLK